MALLAATLCTACHESLEDRAERECREFTRKNCPTPVKDNTRTDSMVFRRDTRTVCYYFTLSGPADNADVFRKNEPLLRETLRKDLAENTQTKVYKDAGFHFSYIFHSAKEPKKTLFSVTFGPKDLNR